MDRRQFVMGGLLAMVGFRASAATPAAERLKWNARIKGCLCSGCGRKLKDKLVKMPGVTDVTVNVKNGDVELFSTDKRTNEKTIREIIETTNFKVISINGPVKVTR